MKKKKYPVLMFLLLLTVAFVVACSDNTSAIDSEKRELDIEHNTKGFVDVGDLGGSYYLVEDPNTGCVYVKYSQNTSYRTGLSAYYGEDGEVVGCGDKSEKQSSSEKQNADNEKQDAEKESKSLVVIGELGTNCKLVKDNDSKVVYVQKNEGKNIELSPYNGEDEELLGCGEYEE